MFSTGHLHEKQISFFNETTNPKIHFPMSVIFSIQSLNNCKNFCNSWEAYLRANIIAILQMWNRGQLSDVGDLCKYLC